MANLDRIRLDTEKLDDGAWFTHPIGFRFRVRRSSYAPFREAVQERTRELRGRYGDEIPQEELIRVAAEETGRHCVSDWEQVTEGAEDTPVEFSPDRAAKLLSEPVYVDLYAWVTACSNKSEAYRVSAKEKTLGK